MWPLIRYQSVNYLKYLVPLMIFLAFYFTEFYSRGKLPVFIFLCFWAFMMVSGSITTCESYESKNKGYHILSGLPVTNREIVSAKFILVMGAVVLATGLNIVLLLLRNDSIAFRSTMIMIGVLWGIFCLLYGGGVYIGIFRFGFSKTTNFVWLFFLFTLVLLFFVFEDITKTTGFKISSLRRFADSLLWIPLAVIGIAAYYLMFRYALKLKNAGEEN